MMGKKAKIPGSYRKPMKDRKFRKLQSMLTDTAEKKMMEKYFPADDSGRRKYSPPTDKRTGKKIVGILVKVKKARQGPRTLRIVLLSIVILVPVLFNILFLDIVASRQLEKILEKSLNTDVDIRGLDISIPGGKVELAGLAVASRSNPMLDSFLLEDAILDFRVQPLFQRRLIIETIRGSLDFNRARVNPAIYPDGNDAGEDEEKSRTGEDSGFGWMPVPELPTASTDLAAQLRADAEEDADQWAENLAEDQVRIESLITESRDLINQPLPDKADIPAWLSRTEEGKRLIVEIRQYESLVSEYRNSMNESAARARNASVEARKALEADLAALEDSFIPDSEMVNLWLSSALQAYAGPGVARGWESGLSLYRRFGGSLKNGGRRREQKENDRRMKSGRIVPFAVSLPPRFTIAEIDLSGSGVVIRGSNVGVDHDAAGAPSEMALQLDGAPGIPGRFEISATVDNRSSSSVLLSGKLNASGLSWSVGESAGDAASGSLEADASFTIPRSETRILESTGRIILENWKEGHGNLAFIDDSTPELGFGFQGKFSDKVEELKVEVDSASIQNWAVLIAASFIPGDTSEARQELEDAINGDLEGLDAILGGWNESKGDIDSLDSALGTAEDELQKLLEESAAGAGVDIPVEIPAGTLEGLKSLF